MASPSVFPLRLRSERLRTLVRELAARDRISQNEFIEQALEHEVVVRGALVADELAAAAKRLSDLTDEQYAEVVKRSIDSFAAGEAGHDPIEAKALHNDATPATAGRHDRLGVLAAFESGR